MNSHFAFIAAALAFVASVNGDGQKCSFMEETMALARMAPLYNNEDLKQCSQKSGFSMMDSKTMPTPEQKAAMCATNECHAFIGAVGGMNPPHCILKIPGGGLEVDVSQMCGTFEKDCADIKSKESRSIDLMPPFKQQAAPAPASETDSDDSSPKQFDMTFIDETTPTVTPVNNSTKRDGCKAVARKVTTEP
ncbi:hypothetical protein CCR75_009065 [Bremia lactucae]|uniref:Elicitin n=1 Tax=Bremia lactucae TaxID=4779 RepID=A0A976IHF4_BRELC|nr:hypothetical protein CCR75_009065 [Bremia lactucae]